MIHQFVQEMEIVLEQMNVLVTMDGQETNVTYQSALENGKIHRVHIQMVLVLLQIHAFVRWDFMEPNASIFIAMTEITVLQMVNV